MTFDQCLAITRQDARSGPCEDDYEAKCPFIEMLPDESNEEEGSPLNFRSNPHDV